MRLLFKSDRMADVLLAPPFSWRANLEDFCHSDLVEFRHYPYPIPEPGKTQTCCRDDGHHGTPCGISSSFGGLTYERTIKLAGLGAGGLCWQAILVMTSRDDGWLASLTRADAAALVSLDSVAR